MHNSTPYTLGGHCVTSQPASVRQRRNIGFSAQPNVGARDRDHGVLGWKFGKLKLKSCVEKSLTFHKKIWSIEINDQQINKFVTITQFKSSYPTRRVCTTGRRLLFPHGRWEELFFFGDCKVLPRAETIICNVYLLCGAVFFGMLMVWGRCWVWGMLNCKFLGTL